MDMIQSKKHSAFESIANVVVGYLVSFAANMTILPLFGFTLSVSDGAWIGVFYTIVSLFRSYILRRIFNRLTSHSGTSE
jgi:hypothetical protein